ncbi:hypothetical protein B0H13DRAFT_938932, partial [Mycena leptocephala]
MRSFPETGSVAAGNPSYPTHNIHNHSFMGQPAKSRRGSLQTFNNVGGNMTQLHLTSHGNSGLDILYRSIALTAVYDSGERFPEPACHPGTRENILSQLTAWSVDTRPESTLLWLYGSAGMGKPALAQMFARECDKAGRLGATFFFKRRHSERGTCHRLLISLAYQLAHSVPGLFLPVQHAVERDNLIVARTIQLQFSRLIVEPFKQVPRPQIFPVIILDGLDECEDYLMQQMILRLFIKSAR